MECPICYDIITKSDLNQNILPCNHYFHSDCIKEWLKNK